MTDEDFEATVERLERVAERNPAGYRRSVFLWTVFGMTMAWLVPFVLLGIVVAIVWFSWTLLASLWVMVKLFKVALLPLLVLVGGALKLLTRKLDPPTGMPLTPASYPELFAIIDGVAREVGVRSPEEVLLTNEFNAAMAEVPRVPFLPIYSTHLILGARLLASVTREEFEAVLAHELGHLAGAHGRSSARVYRVRRVWAEMAEQMSGPTAWFLRWYAPRYNAQTFVLARQDEYFADRTAARVTSPRTAADALIRSNIEDAVQDEAFWQPLRMRAQREPEPPLGVYKALFRSAGALGDAAQREVELRGAMARESDLLDTHPSLAARLAALEVEPRVPPPVERSAAAELLGDRAELVAEHLSTEWREAVGPQWQAVHQRAQAMKARVAELEALAEPRACDEELELGHLCEALGRDGSAMLAFRRAHEVDSENPGAQLALGRVLVDGGDESGLELLDRARTADPELELEATQAIYAHHVSTGEAGAERAATELERLTRAYAERARGQEERSTLSMDDELVRAELTAEERASLVEAMREAGVKGAWVARKLTEYRPDEPFIIIAIDPDDWGEEPEEKATRAEDSFERACAGIDLPHAWFAISGLEHAKLRDKVKAVTDAELV